MTKLALPTSISARFFARFEAWLDVLKVGYTATPQFSGCLMQTAGKCYREYSFDL
jgi:hypothetical protein